MPSDVRQLGLREFFCPRISRIYTNFRLTAKGVKSEKLKVKNLSSQRDSERLGKTLWGISKLANWKISKLANWGISKLVYSFIVFTFKFFEVVAFEGVFDELGETIGGAGETGDAEFADFFAEFFVVIGTTAIGKG